jgi:DNA-binding transcriptional regulator PaaX
LKAHRTLDGEKVHRLHPLDGPPEQVDSAAVERLKRRGLIASNMKFPASVYLLTERGLEIARNITD